eukprot:g77566.t1
MAIAMCYNTTERRLELDIEVAVTVCYNTTERRLELGIEHGYNNMAIAMCYNTTERRLELDIEDGCDLNYRIEEARAEANELVPPPPESKQHIDRVVRAIAEGQCAPLLELDQLVRARRAGRAFYHWQEAPITFPPTFKFTENGVYSTKKCPSWTDRVLWRGPAE